MFKKKIFIFLACISFSTSSLLAVNIVSPKLHNLYKRLKPYSEKLPSTKKLIVGGSLCYGMWQIFHSRENISSFINSHLTQDEKRVLATFQTALQDSIAHRQSCFEKLPSLSTLTFLGGTALGYFLLRPFYPPSSKETQNKIIFTKVFNTIPRCLLAMIIGYWLTAQFQDKAINLPTIYPVVRMGNAFLENLGKFSEWATT